MGRNLAEKLTELCFPSEDSMFAPYIFKQALIDSGMEQQDFGWKLYNPAKEYARLGLDGAEGGPFRIYSNKDYALCDTYPRCVCGRDSPMPSRAHFADLTNEHKRITHKHRTKGNLWSRRTSTTTC